MKLYEKPPVISRTIDGISHLFIKTNSNDATAYILSTLNQQVCSSMLH